MQMTTMRAAILVLGAIALGMFCIGKVFSPVYVFINDTPAPVHGSLVGGTAPNRQMDLAPGGYAIYNAPLGESVIDRWEPSYLKTSPQGRDIVPTWDFTVLKVVWISKLPIVK